MTLLIGHVVAPIVERAKGQLPRGIAPCRKRRSLRPGTRCASQPRRQGLSPSAPCDLNFLALSTSPCTPNRQCACHACSTSRNCLPNRDDHSSFSMACTRLHDLLGTAAHLGVCCADLTQSDRD